MKCPKCGQAELQQELANLSRGICPVCHQSFALGRRPTEPEQEELLKHRKRRLED